jgi:hypothetical protein
MKQIHIQLSVVVLLLLGLLLIQKNHNSLPRVEEILEETTIVPSSHRITHSVMSPHRQELMQGMLYESDGDRLYQGGKDVPHFKYYYTNERGEGLPPGTKPVNLRDQFPKSDDAFELVNTPKVIPDGIPLETKLKLHMFTVHIIVQRDGYPGEEIEDESVAAQRLLKLTERTVKHYAQSERVHKIVLVWNLKQMRARMREAVIEKLQKLQSIMMNPPQDVLGVSSRPVPVFVVRDLGNTVNNAFKPHLFIETEAVFTVKVGTLVSVSDLNYGYLIWKWFPNLLIGFSTNTKKRNIGEPLLEKCPITMTYQNAEIESSSTLLKSDNQHFGAICVERDSQLAPLFANHPRHVLISSVPTTLTGSFYHRKYLDAYTYEIPKSVHHYIDQNPTLLDLAFSQMITQMTQYAPILVKPDQPVYIPQIHLQNHNTNKYDHMAVTRKIIALLKSDNSEQDPQLYDSFIRFVDFSISRVTLRDVT